jgi:hypothetical protein
MQAMKYSPSTCGFYTPGQNAPADAVAVTTEEHAALIEGQARGGRIVFADGKPVVDFAPVPKTWEQIRAQRDKLLASSDWTQMPDNALTDEVRAAWAAYRQALRDMTETVTDPAAVEWPVAPA